MNEILNDAKVKSMWSFYNLNEAVVGNLRTILSINTLSYILWTHIEFSHIQLAMLAISFVLEYRRFD